VRFFVPRLLLGVGLLVAGCQLVFGDFNIDKGPCERGAKQCFGNVLQTCNTEGTAWTNVALCASEALCDPAHGCKLATCADGDRRCDNAEFQICKSTRDGWSNVQACADAGHCSAESGCTSEPCQAGTLQCNGAVLRQCLPDQSDWRVADTCASATLCTKSGCTMQACKPGQFRCSGAELQTCNDMLDGFTTVKSCDSAALCDDATGTCGTAGCTTPGAFRCTDTGVLEKCLDDLTAWMTFDTCKKGAAFCDAVSGSCKDEPCTPGTYQCSGVNLQVCNADSSGWRAVDMCETEGLCQATLGAGATTCAKPMCAAGATQCVDAEPQICNADRTAFKANGPACATPELCNAGSGTCTLPQCDPGQTQCMGAQPVICNPGRTGYVANAPPCASVALCNVASGTCGDKKCVAGQLRCDPENPTHLQHCNADLTDWEPIPCDTCETAELCAASLAATTCDALSCKEPVCSAGETRCVGSGTDQGKALGLCNAGRTDFTPCETCATPELCELSRMTTPFSCKAGACTKPSCSSTDRWCGGTGNTALYQCPSSLINTQATVLATCATNGLCELTRSKNETKCEAPTCALTDLWCGGTGNTVLYQCPSSLINSQAVALDTCATNGLCELSHSKNETKCEAPTCVAGDLWCGGTGNKSLYQCPASRISAQGAVLDTCLTSGLCDLTRSKKETKCEAAVCATGDTRCSGTAMTTLQMCNADRTGFSDCDTCTSAQLCTDSLGAKTCNSSACLACAVGEAHCDTDGNYETCKADRSGFSITDCMGALCDETLGGCQ
jgi:hypothetical protein